MSLFKFFPKDDDLIEKIFIRDGFCAVKCTLPQDYNDPYELFLGLDTSVETQDLAFYYDVIQKIPQIPTTCFSRSLLSLPMWAHYASNHAGYVIEFDLEVLQQHFAEASIKDVKYISEPDKNIAEILKMASRIGKPRYLGFLYETVRYNAYFSKYKEWSYEQECRFVATGDCIEKIGINDLLFIPIEAIKSIVLGKNISDSNKTKLLEISEKYNIKVYYLNISKTSSSPFFTDLDNRSYIFDKKEIILAHKVCKECPQPLSNTESETCEICSITEAHRQDAANRNAFRMLAHYNLLDDYIEGFREISKNR